MSYYSSQSTSKVKNLSSTLPHTHVFVVRTEANFSWKNFRWEWIMYCERSL
jgi:hypothetical protein